MTSYSRTADWVHKAVFDGSEAVLVPLISNEADLTAILQLNETALYIWELLEKPISEDEIERRVCEHYELTDSRELARVREDVAGYLSELRSLGAVQSK